MESRSRFFVIGLAAAGLWLPALSAAPAPPKEATVTLAVTGMT